MNILGVVIIYYPNIEETLHNINKYINDISHLIVWDNTPNIGQTKHKFPIPDEQTDKITYITTGNNEGISFALNKALQYASENNFSHMLTMDQDSEWINFSAFKNFARKHSKSIIGPLINDEVLSSSENRSNHIITSGMLVPVKTLRSIGGYWEEFKIDGIDTELCYRAKSSGIKILQSPKGRLKQNYGNPKEFVFLGRRLWASNYSPSRLYGITRSCGIIIRKYHVFKPMRKDYFRYTILFSFNILFAENRKIQKLHSIWKGVFDGLLCDLSKLKPI